MPIPCFDISRHMVVLVASPRNTDNALRVLHPPSRRPAAICISVAAVPNFLLSDRRRIRRRHLCTMLKTPITRISRKVRRPLSRSVINATLWRCDLTPCLCLIFIGGAPNRPLPPTPDEEESGDRTLVMKRVSISLFKNAMQAEIYICRPLLFRSDIFHFGTTWNFHIPLVCNIQILCNHVLVVRVKLSTCFLPRLTYLVVHEH